MQDYRKYQRAYKILGFLTMLYVVGGWGFSLGSIIVDYCSGTGNGLIHRVPLSLLVIVCTVILVIIYQRNVK